MSAPERTTMNGKPVLTRPAKSVLNMKSAFAEKLLCTGPTFSMGDTCAYSCTFCYVPDLMKKAVWFPKEHQPEHIVLRREQALDVLKANLASLKPDVRQHPHTIYASPLVDVSPNADLTAETVAACTLILLLTAWDIRLLSKSTFLPKVAKKLLAVDDSDDWRDEVRRRMIFGVSTGTLDDSIATAFEVGCPPPSKRLASLHQLQDEGFRTFGMLCPSLPQRGSYQEWSAELVAAIRPEHCEHVWAEVINVRGDSMTRTVEALHNAGHEWTASALKRVSHDRAEWEEYARKTFLSHACRTDLLNADGTTKLRFLQYVTPRTHDWWHQHVNEGAVLLGKAAH